MESTELQAKTYEEISQEFRELYPGAIRAYQLVGEMYTVLTQADGFSHRAAINKIQRDHKDLTGFSGRNIRRYLPSGNPNIPRRIRPSRPKNSSDKTATLQKFSNTKSVNECPQCSKLKLNLEEITQALDRATKVTTADSLKLLEGIVIVPKEKQQIVMKAFQKSKQLTHLTFGSDGILFDARPDYE